MVFIMLYSLWVTALFMVGVVIIMDPAHASSTHYKEQLQLASLGPMWRGTHYRPGYRVAFLPSHAETVIIDGITYKRLNNTYYRPKRHGFVVTAEPNRAEMASYKPRQLVSMANRSQPQISVYPAKGQSRLTKRYDRSACRDQAAEEVGKDPLVDYLNRVENRQFYQANIHCLEARGYTVQSYDKGS
uniref:Uncharacterized protein n=1 Tax=Magnetococcus massalia (strain MO-1) TaxID=451514 RepID=A0A1S7LFM3_MAGMO|nr:Exported protein of unknown function [Candidatus Magnetococcus massalia]